MKSKRTSSVRAGVVTAALRNAARRFGQRARVRKQGMDAKLTRAFCRCRVALTSERGQGTTEYAILVGVLVVIAILAITVFRPKLQELWNAISDGINSL